MTSKVNFNETGKPTTATNVLDSQKLGVRCDADMIKRRAFLSGTLTAASFATCKVQAATIQGNAVTRAQSEPLVWPLVAKVRQAFDRSSATRTPSLP